MRKVGFFDLYVEDMERAQKFYETVLETKLSQMDDPNDPSVEMRMFSEDLESYGAVGALVKVKGAKPGAGGTMVYFSCADCEVEQARVEQAGGKIIRPKFSIGEHGFVSLVCDTEGNIVGFHSVQ
ncbi:MAG: VOC family protein [Pseudomonadota bacterium]